MNWKESQTIKQFHLFSQSPGVINSSPTGSPQVSSDFSASLYHGVAQQDATIGKALFSLFIVQRVGENERHGTFQQCDGRGKWRAEGATLTEGRRSLLLEQGKHHLMG